ncbi:MAG: branched-chain amino acid ABC transporter permease [Anaerolineae bacterium]|nr:branched-chain amino acid ABC transporter permease [Anaerolineae bacterium]
MNNEQTITKIGSGQRSPLGMDEWVAQSEQRRRRPASFSRTFVQGWASFPPLGRMALMALVLVSLPFVTSAPPVLSLLRISNNDFIVRLGATFLAYSILVIGLNIVVGFAGLLDLGYVAFWGLAGYAYAYLSSDFAGLHVPAIISLPLIVGFTALTGWGIGRLTLRLHGDYLAIITLGFGLLFVQLTSTLTRVQLPWLNQPLDLTRGPNGLNNLDELVLFGYRFESTWSYYFLFLVLLSLVALVVHHLDRSRLGRAWRAMREDELAAEALGMPTSHLKLLAFAFGAAIAGLVGAVFAAWQGNVVPGRYDALSLINLYAMLILGGLGSLPGAMIGALVFTVLPEVLRSVEVAGFLFYGGGLLALVRWLKVSPRLAAILSGTLLGGVMLNLGVNWFWPGFDSGIPPAAGSFFNQWAQSWLVIPADFKLVGNIAIGLAMLLLWLSLWLKKSVRWILLSLAIYLAVFAWETRLAGEPAVTRLLVVGATLIILMITRPQGMLGKPQVRVV